MSARRQPAARFAAYWRAMPRVIHVIGRHNVVVIVIMRVLVFFSPGVAVVMGMIGSLVHIPPQVFPFLIGHRCRPQWAEIPHFSPIFPAIIFGLRLTRGEKDSDYRRISPGLCRCNQSDGPAHEPRSCGFRSRGVGGWESYPP